MIVIKGQIKDEENVIGENRYKNLSNPTNPTNEDIAILENYLAGNKHTRVLYITKTGGISFAKFQYIGGFPDLKEYEGKYFSRLDIREKTEYSISTKKYSSKKFYIPVPDCEIVNEYINNKFFKKEVNKTRSLDELNTMYDNILFEQYKQKYYN